MIPYIQDRNGNIYEFVGSMKLKKNYEKEMQRELQREMFSKLSDEEIEMLEEAQKTNDTTKVRAITRNFMANVDVEEINEKINLKYIKVLLSNKYCLSDRELNALVEELYEDYGEEQINERFAKILEKVFTQLGNNENQKVLPAWGIE